MKSRFFTVALFLSLFLLTISCKQASVEVNTPGPDVPGLDEITAHEPVVTAFAFSLSLSELDVAEQYQFQVSPTDSFDSTLLDITQAGNTILQSLEPFSAGQYYWRGRGIDGENQSGPWTAVGSFTLEVPNWTMQPADNGNSTDTTPTFTWGALEGADRYEIQIGSGETEVLVSTAISCSTTSFTPSISLTNNARHFWRVRAINGEGQSSMWSLVQSFDIAWGSITGMSPADNSSTTDTTPTFSWDSVAGAASYNLQIADSETGVSGAAVESVAANSFTPASSLTNNASHYWRVQAVNGDGETTLWSAVQSLDIAWGSITGMSPAANSTTTDTTPTFSWDALDGAVSYNFQIADSEAGVSGAAVESVAANSFTPASSLTNNASHYWRVQAMNGDGETSLWSAVQSLDIAWGSITGMSPAANSTTTDTTPTFSWDSVVGAVSYNFQIADSEAGVSGAAVESVAANSLTPASSLTNNASHYWRVQAVNGDGETTLWSAVQSLDIAWGSITGMSPAANSTTTDTTPTFSWDAVDGADHYEIQIAESEAVVESATAVSVSTNSYTLTETPEVSDQRYWRVRAVDAGSNTGLWSDIFVVVIVIVVPPSVGDSIGGGIVFYVDEADLYDFDVLIAAASDLSGSYEWGGNGISVGGTSPALGTGESNTEAIVSAYGATDPHGLSNYAAKVCYDLELNGYDDWYLPSKAELDLMYDNKSIIGGFESIYYWSSSEYSSYDAWVQSLYNGGQFVDYKNSGSDYYVRPIRAFNY